MTITADRRPTPSASREPIAWTVVQRGLWVGNRNGEFAGMIEADRELHFTATSGLAKTIGTFDSFEAAKASLAGR